MRQTALVVGGDGMLGRALVDALHARGQAVRATSRRGRTGAAPLDLGSDTTTWPIPEDVSVAFLCAGLTNVRTCANDSIAARAVNVDGTIELGRRLIEGGCRVVFISTNMVFDGSIPFTPATAAVAPKTEYGRLKAEAERGLLALGPRVCVVRFSKVLALHMPLVDSWAEALGNHRPIHPFSDMLLAPIGLALAVRVLLSAADANARGILQFTASTDVAYAEMAVQLAEAMKADAALVQPRCVAAAETTFEHVPAHTTLDSATVAATLGIQPPSPWEAIDAVVRSAVSDAGTARKRGRG